MDFDNILTHIPIEVVRESEHVKFNKGGSDQVDPLRFSMDPNIHVIEEEKISIVE